MSVHTSVARCLRTSSTLGHPTPSSFRGRQLFQFYQTSRYATNDSPNEKQTAKPDGSAAQSTSSTASPAEGTTGPARPSPSSAATNSTEASAAAAGAAGTTNNDNTTGSPNLMESLATLRENVRYATQPIDLVRATRKFQRGGGGVATRAHQTAQEQLDRLLGRKPTGSSGQQQQQQRQPAAAQPGTASEGSPLVPSSASSSSPSVLDQNDSLKPPPKVRGVPIKLGTKLGRQVLVSHERGVDLAGAIRMVQINCAVNGVRRQSNQQKFHVRRGQRRKDLKSQRWRKLFKFSFDATVKKIQRMRNQGW